MASFILLSMYILITEISFRILYRIIHGSAYCLIRKVPFKSMYVEPHPYLPFVYKKNHICQKASAIPDTTYPLAKGKGYWIDELKTNSLRHLNGPRGNREIVIPKPKGVIRINCLGASTTANYILHKGRNFSYPMELEKVLQGRFPNLALEVNNFAQGGFTTAEILIKFLLNTVDTEPDVIILYHAYNDLGPSLTNGFQSDYSHAKRNLGEVYHLYRWASAIPYIPLASCNYIINNFVFSQNLRYSLLHSVAKAEPDTSNEFQGLATYRRNIEHLIHICKGRNIKVVLSTFCHFLYEGIKDNAIYRKYHEGVIQENATVRELASKYELILVDNAVLIPQESRYFVDSIHFTPEGMALIAENFSKALEGYLQSLDRGQPH